MNHNFKNQSKGETIAIFDLDHTLIKEDSDYLWGEYLCQKKWVDVKEYQAKNKEFFAAYKRNQINFDAYLKFCLSALKNIPMARLLKLRSEFIQLIIKPEVSKEMMDILDWHKKQNHFIVIITSTHDFITRPIADLLEVQYLIATQAEIIDGEFSGQYLKPACFQRNKIKLFNNWLKDKQIQPDFLYGYSDSIHDLALLQFVDVPCAVNPDNKLREIAKQNQWKIIDYY